MRVFLSGRRAHAHSGIAPKVHVSPSGRRQNATSALWKAPRRAKSARFALWETPKCDICPLESAKTCQKCTFRSLGDAKMRHLPSGKRQDVRKVYFWHVLALSRGQMSHFGVSQRAKSALLARLGAFQRADVAFWRLPEGETCTFGTSWRFPEGRCRILASPRGRNVHFWRNSGMCMRATSRQENAHFGTSQRAKCALLARLGAFQKADVAFWRLPEGEMCTFGTSWRFPEGRCRILASPRSRKLHFWLHSVMHIVGTSLIEN